MRWKTPKSISYVFYRATILLIDGPSREVLQSLEEFQCFCLWGDILEKNCFSVNYSGKVITFCELRITVRPIRVGLEIYKEGHKIVETTIPSLPTSLQICHLFRNLNSNMVCLWTFSFPAATYFFFFSLLTKRLRAKHPAVPQPCPSAQLHVYRFFSLFFSHCIFSHISPVKPPSILLTHFEWLPSSFPHSYSRAQLVCLSSTDALSHWIPGVHSAAGACSPVHCQALLQLDATRDSAGWCKSLDFEV